MRLATLFALVVLIALSITSCRDDGLVDPPEGTSASIITNGEFTTNATSTRNMVGDDPAGWMPGTGSPQIATGPGADSARGYIQMWGNATLGESITQRLTTPIVAGARYRLSAWAKFMDENPQLTTKYAIIRFVAYKTSALPIGPGHMRDVPGRSAEIARIRTSSRQWEKHTPPEWTADDDYDGISIDVENEVPDDGTPYTVSWGHLDKLSMVRLCGGGCP